MVQEFESLFEKKSINFDEPLFNAWLVLKNSSLPTEAQVVASVLQDHLASNVPKKKTQRKQNLPVGPARYDPSSPEWEMILIEQSEKSSKKSTEKSKHSVAKSRIGINKKK